MQIKISVVVPTYQRPGLLHQCIEALVNQRFDKDAYELIIVSDGPDEVTKKDVQLWQEKAVMDIRYLSSPLKKGPAAARNIGWRNATGTIIAFTDDDCIPDTGWLSAIWKAYSNEAEIAFTGKIIVPVTQHPTDFERNTQGLETANFVTANCACSKQALMKVNGFDEQFSMAWREDSDLEFKLLQQSIPICRISNAVVIHPVRHAEWGVSIKEQKKGMFNALLYKKYPELYRQKIQAQPPWNYYVIIALSLVIVVGIFLESGVVTALAGMAWIGFILQLVLKRLSGTSRSFSHVMEMIVTSMAIPFLSVYWQLYGAWKFRVLFI